jgi:DNA-binding Lrp family transcriptional regulator
MKSDINGNVSREALLFISINLKKRTLLEQKIIRVKGVKRILEISGQYDIAVEIRAEDRDKLEDIIASMRNIEGIEKISTYVT